MLTQLYATDIYNKQRKVHLQKPRVFGQFRYTVCGNRRELKPVNWLANLMSSLEKNKTYSSQVASGGGEKDWPPPL